MHVNNINNRMGIVRIDGRSHKRWPPDMVMNRLCCQFGIVMLMLGTARAGYADVVAPPPYPAQCAPARQQSLNAIVDRKLEIYRSHFPEIQFVVLSARDRHEQGMAELLRLLGDGAANLDYEHPPGLRADLLAVSLARVAIMLRNHLSSSALFQAGQNGQAQRRQLCVLTLDVCNLASDSRQATFNMLPIPEQEFERMPDRQHLDADLHMEYVIDHEVHHCLKAHRGEPIPMSMHEHWSDYMQRRNETAADAYGLAMHILKYGTDSQYVSTLIAIRGLSLLAGDPDHYTTGAMGATLRHLCKRPDPGPDIDRSLAIAARIRETFIQGYEDYLKFRYAAFQAMSRLGVEDEDGPSFLAELPGYQPDPAHAETLLLDTAAHYQLLFASPLYDITE